MLTKNSYVMHIAHEHYKHVGGSWSMAVRFGWMALTIRQTLQKGVMEFEYVKRNGEVRHARGTLHPVLIAADKVPQQVSTAKANYNAIAYYDIDKADWRAFRIGEFCHFITAYLLTEYLP